MDAPRGVQGPRGRNFARWPLKTSGRRSLVNDFAVKGEIEAVALDFLRDT